jgi:hypothetical protein
VTTRTPFRTLPGVLRAVRPRSNSGSAQRALLSGIMQKLEQTYGLMGVSVSRFSNSDGSSLGATFQAREDLGGIELGQALGLDGTVDMREEGETDTVDQGRDAAGGTHTATNGRKRKAKDDKLHHDAPV